MKSNTEILRDFIESYDQNISVLVDILGAEVNSHAIYQVPSVNGGIVKTYITGASEYRIAFEYATRFNYTEERVQNIHNSSYFEDFSEWIETRNKTKELPEIGTPLSLRTIMTPQLRAVDPDGKRAEYVITLEFIYKKEA